MDQTGGQSPGIDLTSSLFLLPLETVQWESLPTPHPPLHLY